MTWLSDILSKFKGGGLLPKAPKQQEWQKHPEGGWWNPSKLPQPTTAPPRETLKPIQKPTIRQAEPTPTPTRARTPVPSVAGMTGKSDSVKRYFDYYKAPLSEHAGSFSNYSEKYGLDYRIAPVITMLETSGGKNLKSGIKHNVGNVAIRSGWDYESFDDAIKGLVSIIGGRSGDEWTPAQKRNAAYYEAYRKTITKDNPIGDLEMLAKIFEPNNPDYAKNLRWGVENFEEIIK